LTAIKASASSLLQEDVQWDQQTRRGFAQTIEREADRLNRLVSNLLDMSRIEEGALRPEKELYSLKSLIYDVLDRLQPLLKEHNVEVKLPDDLLLVEIDYMQIDQVITNLFENAARYTPAGTEIEIVASKQALVGQGEAIVVEVKDHGPGLARGEHERIFDKFYRVLTVHAGRPGGSGLGLSVCKGIIEAHGGQIRATTTAGGGLTVTFQLPLSGDEGENYE
jgi:two-component system sensor histidine kinase KdpD